MRAVAFPGVGEHVGRCNLCARSPSKYDIRRKAIAMDDEILMVDMMIEVEGLAHRFAFSFNIASEVTTVVLLSSCR